MWQLSEPLWNRRRGMLHATSRVCVTVGGWQGMAVSGAPAEDPSEGVVAGRLGGSCTLRRYDSLPATWRNAFQTVTVLSLDAM